MGFALLSFFFFGGGGLRETCYKRLKYGRSANQHLLYRSTRAPEDGQWYDVWASVCVELLTQGHLNPKSDILDYLVCSLLLKNRDFKNVKEIYQFELTGRYIILSLSLCLHLMTFFFFFDCMLLVLV